MIVETEFHLLNKVIIFNNKWKNLIIDIDKYKMLIPIAANAISHLDFLKQWYNNTSDEYVILMEDDYDLNLIPRWNFSWKELVERLPYDWDCILLGFENPTGIRFHLHPIEDAHDFGPVLLELFSTSRFLTPFANTHTRTTR